MELFREDKVVKKIDEMKRNGPRTHSPIPCSRHQKRRRRTATRRPPPFLKRVKTLFIFIDALGPTFGRSEDHHPQREGRRHLHLALGGECRYDFFGIFLVFAVADFFFSPALIATLFKTAAFSVLVRRERNGERMTRAVRRRPLSTSDWRPETSL
jgi:hypothetical protein